jgi:hypothetical protein
MRAADLDIHELLHFFLRAGSSPSPANVCFC